VIVEVPVLRREIANIRPHDHEAAAWPQNAPHLGKCPIALVVGAQMLEEVSMYIRKTYAIATGCEIAKMTDDSARSAAFAKLLYADRTKGAGIQTRDYQCGQLIMYP